MVARPGPARYAFVAGICYGITGALPGNAAIACSFRWQKRVDLIRGLGEDARPLSGWFYRGSPGIEGLVVRDARRCRAPHHEGLKTSDLILRRREAPSRRMYMRDGEKRS